MVRYKRNTGQSTVEYILLVTAVIAVMILFTTNKKEGLQHKLNETLDSTAGGITTLGDRLGESHTATPKGAASPGAPKSTPVI